jgi:hypothetical protein
VIASASGFTEGAVAYARDKGIDLLHLRGLTDKDWEGRIRAVQITMRLATFVLEAAMLVVPVGVDVEGRLSGLEEADADLLDDQGVVLGNVIHVMNQGIPAKMQDREGAQETTLDFPPGSHLMVEGRSVPVLGLKVTFHQVVQEKQCTIDAGTVLKAVLENIVTGERHSVTTDNRLLIGRKTDN